MLFVWMLSKKGPPLSVSLARIVMPLVIILALTGTAMAFYNLRVTGKAFRMPYQIYEDAYSIAPKFIWQSVRPEPIFHHQALRDAARGPDLTLYRLERSVLGFIMKNVAFLSWWLLYSLNVFLLPLIILFSLIVRWALRNHWAGFALVTYCLFALGLMMEVPMMIHYAAPIISFNYLFAVQAIRLSTWGHESGKVCQAVSRLVPFVGATALVVALFVRIHFDDASSWYKRRAGILEQLEKVEGRHLIIVSYGPDHLVHEEWVHNNADIDSSKVVWAREMDTARNCKLIRYFKDRYLWSLDIDSNHSIPKLQPHTRNL
jgi:hypothetical protein